LQSREEAEKAEKARRETEQAKAEIDQFLKDLSDLQGKMTERGIVLTMGDVWFSFGKAIFQQGLFVTLIRSPISGKASRSKFAH